MTTEILQDEIHQLFINARKCDLTDRYFHIEIKSALVEFISEQNKLEESITELLEKGNVKTLRLGGGATTVYAIYCNEPNDKLTAFYRKEPIFGKCIIAEIWKIGEQFNPKCTGGIKLSSAFSNFAKLNIPNLANKTIKISPF